MTIKTRKLIAKDLRVLAGVLSKNMKSLTSMSVRLEGESKDDHSRRVGQSIIASVLANSLDDVWAWIADLGCMTASELDEAPLDTPLDILMSVYNEPDNQGFFAKASAMFTGAVSDETSTQ